MSNFQWLTGPGAGIILMLIILAGVAVIFVIQPHVKKVTNMYWFWLGIAIFMLAYYIGARFSVAWKNLANYMAEHGGKWPDGDTYDGANLISRAFMLDFCPFFGLLVPILLIVDPSRRLASWAGPILVLGCAFTIFGGFPTSKDISLDPFWVFVGPEGWQLYVGLHAVNFWVGIGLILNSPKLGWKGYIGTACFVVGFIFYVLIVKGATGCRIHTSGLSVKDWCEWTEIVEGKEVVYSGTYNVFTKALGGNYKVAMGIIWPLELCSFFGTGALFDLLIKNSKYFKFGNARSKKWWAWYDYNRYEVDKNIFGLHDHNKIRRVHK